MCKVLYQRIIIHSHLGNPKRSLLIGAFAAGVRTRPAWGY